MDEDLTAQDNGSSRLPIEVCENIIDMLYSQRWADQVDHVHALHSCALVSRDWRIRSQRNLFYSIVLHSTEALYKLAAVLDNGPHLCGYIHEVTLIGRTLHTTASPLSLFPVVLYRKLPRLNQISVNHVPAGEEWYPRTSELAPAKLVEHLPLLPRFPLFLSAFSTVTKLFIANVTFRHFNDFLGMVHVIPSLQHLLCANSSFKAFGPLPMYARPPTGTDDPCARPFAPGIQELELVRTSQCEWQVCNIIGLVRYRHTLCSSVDIGVWAGTQEFNSQHRLRPGCRDGDVWCVLLRLSLQWLCFLINLSP